MFFSRPLLAQSNLTLLSLSRLVKIYHSTADIELAKKNPPLFIQTMPHYPGGHFIQLLFDPINTITTSQSMIKKSFSHHTTLKVITYPGISVEPTLVPLLRTAKAELGNTNNPANFYETAASYVPQYSPLERFGDLLTYYENEMYVGKESRYIAENILLPFALHHLGSHAPLILKGFSMGGHELKMAFTYLIQILQSKKYTDSQIKDINEKIIVYTVGTSLNWSQENPLHHLYPTIIHVLAIEDQGVTHLKATSDLINSNAAVFENKTEATLITRNNHPAAQEMMIIPPLGKMRITPKDHSHNLNSYETIIQENSPLKSFLTQMYHHDLKAAMFSQRQTFLYQPWSDIKHQKFRAF